MCNDYRTIEQIRQMSNEQFLLDCKEYRTAKTPRRIELEKKWGARAPYLITSN